MLHTGTNVLPAVKIALYRIAQQALNNVVKHADAHRVCVTLAYRGGGVVLRVRDDGQGFAAGTAAGWARAAR